MAKPALVDLVKRDCNTLLLGSWQDRLYPSPPPADVSSPVYQFAVGALCCSTSVVKPGMRHRKIGLQSHKQGVD